MTVNSHLNRLAGFGIVRSQEKLNIQTSINAITTRLKLHFGDEVTGTVVFGSYSRNTILPRFMDDNSDIDLMVTFDGQLTPQSYLRKLRTFVEKFYNRSEIKQSNPTIVLNLGHIKFELVPAISSIWSGLQIPAKASDYADWMQTDPNDFNEDLSRVNKAHNNLVKPAIRLFKYWNAINQRPFESYLLEKEIVQESDFVVAFWGRKQNLQDYFLSTLLTLELGWLAPGWKKEKLDRAQNLASDIQTRLRRGEENEAKKLTQRLLPEPGTTLLSNALRN